MEIWISWSKHAIMQRIVKAYQEVTDTKYAQ